MITGDQLKDIEKRVEDLNRYLDIESKKIEVEEEELRTHVADFWDDREKAEAQMRKIKGIHFWIDSYTALEKQLEELKLSMDFIKEGLVTEEEITEAAVRAFTARYLLGLFDGSEFDEIPYEKVECREHLCCRLRRKKDRRSV